MVKHVLRHRGVSTRQNYFRMPARARGAERAPRGAETRAKFVTLAVSPKKIFLANLSETSPECVTYHQVSCG